MNISDPIPISSTGSNGSIGVDAARQRSNNTQSSGGTSRMETALGSLPQSSSSASQGLGGGSSQYGSMPLGSPNERAGFIVSSSSNMNMAGLALDVQNVPGPSTQQNQVVPVGFEEGTLRALCDLDCGFPLLMDRIKQSMASCRVSRCVLMHRNLPSSWLKVYLIVAEHFLSPAGDKHLLQETRSDGRGLRTLIAEAHS